MRSRSRAAKENRSEMSDQEYTPAQKEACDKAFDIRLPLPRMNFYGGFSRALGLLEIAKHWLLNRRAKSRKDEN